jgi:hypothetical protein
MTETGKDEDLVIKTLSEKTGDAHVHYKISYRLQ